ncbi:MAG: hypothetical protein KKF24_13325 [Gammaproteobacteria bacterium]|nr:hypothetical protein [Gammaproteobacteria bacterium]MBU1833662.1 hypothetical protein [Gammaproteobacteria bacterium]
MIELQLEDVYTKFKRVSVFQQAGGVMLKVTGDLGESLLRDEAGSPFPHNEGS